MKNLILGLVCIVSITGCTTATTIEKASTVQINKFFKPEYQSKTDERNASIVILRDKGVWGSACNFIVSIDNKKILTIKSNQQAMIYVKPQSTSIEVEFSPSGFCPYARVTEELNLVPNGSTKFRIRSSGSMNNALQLIKVDN
ncbi:hypothetical protein [Acinetobacter vivianii]|uniref:DUF2846 domain-containing protein n=1 Tax=Acinetobacter vivianii TaxID=1776742 RepID=N9Q7D4_9GAMM|nr:hypothetical protein [Acinetobacter vivianii]ENX22340.1 hypothetical protein F892_01582 [Acinetobacter vivianii]GGI58707.1 hypothetical protein GCM10011446_02020 [Acinetobacter vivianii]